MLHSISQKELGHAPLNVEEALFLRQVVERVEWEFVPGGYRGHFEPYYDGWYNRLFYRPVNAQGPFQLTFGSTKWDAVVADVHTDVPDMAPWWSSPGGILHEGTGCAHRDGPQN